MRISTEAIGGDERYDSALETGYFVIRDGGIGQMVMEAEAPNGVAQVQPHERKPRLPSLDLEEPAEPVFPDSEWLATGASNLADHPLLRGLLLELPPKGTAPSPAWLDRWFDATRSILELLYVRDR